MQASAGISLTPPGNTTLDLAAFTINSVPCIGAQKSFGLFQVMLGQRSISKTTEVNICPSTSQNYFHSQVLPPLDGINLLSSQIQMLNFEIFAISLFSAREARPGVSLSIDPLTMHSYHFYSHPCICCHLPSKLQSP